LLTSWERGALTGETQTINLPGRGKPALFYQREPESKGSAFRPNLNPGLAEELFDNNIQYVSSHT
jgi:hypothetical protein